MLGRGGALQAIALVLAFAAVGGCLGGGSDKSAPALDESGRPANEDGGGRGGVGPSIGGAAGATPDVDPGDGSFVFGLDGAQRVVTWANGSFASTDSLDSSSSTRVTNVTLMLEKEIPTVLHANLTYAPPTTGRLTLTFRLQGLVTTSGGPSNLVAAPRIDKRTEFIPIEEGPYEVVVNVARGEATGPLPYQLRIEVEKVVGVVKPDVPVAVPVAAEGGIVFRMVGEPDEEKSRRVTVALWGPDDRFLGRFQEDIGAVVYPTPRGTAGGEYVMMLIQPREGVTVEPFRVAPVNRTLRPLPLVLEVGEKRTVAAGQTANWTFASGPGHVQVGLVLGALDGIGNLGRGTYTGEIVGRGPVLAFSGPAGRLDARLSAVGHENLTAGPYTATVTTRGGAYDVEERWRMYERD